MKVRERLLGDRVSLMRGLEGIVRSISVLGRLTIEAMGGERLEFFDRDEVEALAM